MMDILIWLWASTMPVSSCPLGGRTAGLCKGSLLYSKSVTWRDTPLTKCQHSAVTGCLTGYIRARGHAQKLLPWVESGAAHVTAQRAPHCCVMRQSMEPIQSKRFNTQATWHTGVFPELATSILWVMHCDFTIYNQKLESMGKLYVNRTYRNPYFAAVQQTLIICSLHRYLLTLMEHSIVATGVLAFEIDLSGW